MSAKGKEAADDGEQWVRIVSGDFSFIVKKKVALRSGTLKVMLSGDFAEARERKAELYQMRPIVAESVLEYLAYKTTYEAAKPKEEIPDFYERIAPEIALELLSAADFLES